MAERYWKLYFLGLALSLIYSHSSNLNAAQQRLDETLSSVKDEAEGKLLQSKELSPNEPTSGQVNIVTQTNQFFKIIIQPGAPSHDCWLSGNYCKLKATSQDCPAGSKDPCSAVADINSCCQALYVQVSILSGWHYLNPQSCKFSFFPKITKSVNYTLYYGKPNCDDNTYCCSPNGK